MSSRRSSLTQFFSPTHHHEHAIRKRAQSLHAQSTRDHSILLQHHNDTSHPIGGSGEGNQTNNSNTLDRKSILKLSISAPLPTSSSVNRPHTTGISDAASSSSSPSYFRTSFIETRHYDEPPSSAERKVQFVEPESVRQYHTRPAPENHTSAVGTGSQPGSHNFASTTVHRSTQARSYSTKKRTVARVSITTGKLYYVQEPIPKYPFPNSLSNASNRGTWFSPPPSPSHSHAHHNQHHHHRHSHVFNFTFRRNNHGRHASLPEGVRSHQWDGHGHRWGSHCPSSEARRHGSGSGASSPSMIRHGSESAERDNQDDAPSQEEEEEDHFHPRHEHNHSSPLYTSASERLHAHWGTFTFNMRFSMFRAQDKMKEGVAWAGGVVRRMSVRMGRGQH